MSSAARRLLGACLLLGTLTMMVLLFTGGASATPDSNNGPAQAVEVQSFDVALESVSDIDDLEDYYKIYVDSGELLDAYLVMDSGQDLDLYLFDGSMNLLTQSSTDNLVSGVFTEQVTYDAPLTGWYYISVYAYNGQSDYSLLTRSTAEWTVLVYLDGDNNLEADGITDFLEMSAVGSTPEVNIVVQMDRVTGYDTGYGDWTGANRYRVEQGMVPDAASAWQSLGEVNMGEAATLTDFVVWGASNFPAHHYLLVLWDHGNNWKGVCSDVTSAGDLLELPELSSAMSSASSALGFDMDIIGFDACQMAGVEVYFELSSYTSYFIGSQINEPGTGWNYQLSLARLAAEPSMGAPALCQFIADDYVDSYSVPIPPYASDEVTMSVVDAGRIASLVSSLDDLASEMMTLMEAEHNYYRFSRSSSVSLYDHYVDVYDFVSWLKMYAPDAAVRSAAQAVINASLLTVTFSSFHDLPGGQDLSDVFGMSVYFPTYEGFYDEDYDSTGMNFPAVTKWDEMLDDFYTATSDANDPVEIAAFSPLSDPSVVIGTPAGFSVTLEDEDPDTMTYLWYVDGVQWLALNTSSVNISTSGLSIGNHSVSVTVWDGASDDNQGWSLAVRSMPELLITDFYKEDMDGNEVDRATSGRPTLVSVQVTNAGGTASGFNVTCLVDDVPFCYWNVGGLTAGGSVWLQTLPIILSTVEMHVVTFVLDSDAQVSESDETNNRGAWALYVEKAEWTVLIYMDGDNNLETYMVNNFLQMSAVGSDADVSVVVQFDRIGGYDARYEDWTDCLRFYVEEGMTPTPGNAVADMGEVNMGDDSTLHSFLQWGASTYQADRYIVVLKDHGLTWYGCCEDNTSSHDMLSLTEMSFGLEAMVADIGGPIELLLLDDCLMGSVEVAAQFGGVASYAVVSETIGWTSNHDYSSILSFLQADLLMSGEELALGIVDRMHLVDNVTDITQCVAAYDLQRTDALIAALNEYLDDLSVTWLDDPGYLEYARLYSDSFKALVDDDLIDLYQFVWNTMNIAENDDLNVSGGMLLNILDPANETSFVLVYESTATADFCHGVSAYFPAVMDDYRSLYESSGVFIDVCSWASMVKTYLTAAPPLTFLILDGTQGSNGWYTSPVEVDFLVYDPSSQGVSALEYSFGGAWFAYSGPFTLQVDGAYQLYYHSIGENGVTEDVRVSSVLVDVTKPTASTFVDGYTLTLNGSDAMSGVASLHYRIDGSPWQTYTVPFVVGAVGTQYAVEYYAVDFAGNVGTTLTVSVGTDDTIAPVIAIELSGTAGENGWYVGNVTVILSANDTGGSGLDGIYYRYGNGAWVRYSVPLLIVASGVTELGYYAVDNHGNYLVNVRSIKVDRVAPFSSSVLNGTVSGGWYNDTVTVTLNATDVGSGQSSIMYRLDAGDWLTYVSPFQVSAEGMTVLEWYAVDVAGNVGNVEEREIKVDSSGPAVIVTVTGMDTIGWGDATVRCTVTGADAGSGLSHIMYRVNQGAWTVYDGPIAFNVTGTYLVECYGVDNASNDGAMKNVTNRIDVTTPVSLLSLTGITNNVVFYNSVNVGLNATDVGAGIGSIWYRLDNGSWVSAITPFVLSAEGTHLLSYYAEDLLGNAEAERSVLFTIVLATVPGQVTDIAVEIVDDGMNVKWTAPEDGGAGMVWYKVYRERNGGAAELIATCNGTSWDDGDVAEGDVCSYYVVPVNILGDGVQSPTVTAELSSDTSIDPMIIIIILVVVIAIGAVAAVLFLRKRK